MADPSKYPTRLAPYGLRMPPALKLKVKNAAQRDGRTMNAQIVHHLREIYGTEGESG